MKKTILLSFSLLLLLSPTAYSEEPVKWKEQKSQHFIVYYKNAPKDLIVSIEDMAEQYYKEITNNLGFTRYKNWTFDKRAKIYVYDDQEDYVVSARQLGWSHGAASARRKEIWTFPSAHGFFDSTLPHELGHIIFREFVGFKSVIPLWLDEGVAMYQEKAKRWGANKTVKEAIANETFIPIEELTNMRLYSGTSKDVVDLFYAESASIVYYLITEEGDFRFVRFCRRLERGETFLKALRSVYPHFRTIEDLNRSWLRYLENE